MQGSKSSRAVDRQGSGGYGGLVLGDDELLTNSMGGRISLTKVEVMDLVMICLKRLRGTPKWQKSDSQNHLIREREVG